MRNYQQGPLLSIASDPQLQVTSFQIDYRMTIIHSKHDIDGSIDDM